MAINPDMRASDRDRDRVAEALREHCGQGRITVEELQERLEAIYDARTVGELQKLTADLPEEDMYELPVPASQRSTPAARRPGGLYHTGARAAWATYASVNLICFTIWLVTLVTTAGWVYPWWVWVASPWGAVMLAGRFLGPRDGSR